MVFFSVAGFFHQYYLAMLGAPLAALAGMGLAYLWGLRASHPGRATLLVLATAGVTLGFQIYAVGMYDTLGWWVALPVALAVLGAVGLLLSTRRGAAGHAWWAKRRSRHGSCGAAALAALDTGRRSSPNLRAF